MVHSSRILVTGSRGLVGSAVVRALKKAGFRNVYTPPRVELDLTKQVPVEYFFKDNKIEFVLHCAGLVGGILANSQNQAAFLYENMMMAMNVIGIACEYNVRKLLFLGSSCIYPRAAGDQGLIREEQLLTGPLEPTNEGYAIAKIAGLKLCEFYHRYHNSNCISAMPTNLYGPHDNFTPGRSHVIPALMRRFHEAKLRGDKKVTVWGTGTPIREFLHVDDLAQALLHLMETYDKPEVINIGTGRGTSILNLSEMMRKVVGFKGDLELDPTKPDGTPIKVIDNSKVKALGWEPKISLEEGLRETYEWAVTTNAF